MNKIKILYLGTFGKHCSDKYRVIGLQDSGLYDVVDICDFRVLKKQHGDMFYDIVNNIIEDAKPDVLLMNKVESVTDDDIEYWKLMNPKLVIAYWYGDMRDGLADYVENKIHSVDAFLTNSDDEKYVELISNYGIDKDKIFFSHTATDDKTFKKYNVEEIYDIVFFGGNYNNMFADSEIRLNYIKRLIHENKYKIKIFGNNWNGLGSATKPVYGVDFAKEASKAKIILGFSSFTNIHGYTSNRIWNSMACGFYLCHKYSGIEDMFENGKHLVWFNSYEDMKNKIDYYLTNEKNRKKIFQSGRKNIEKNHTYLNRAVSMYSIFKKLIKDK